MNIQEIKNSFVDFIGITKGMQQNIVLYGNILNENKELINSLYNTDNNYIKNAVNDEYKKFNVILNDFKNLVKQYNIIRNTSQKYPSIKEYMNENIDGFSSDMLNLPVVIFLTTISGSVISLSKNLFEKIKYQNNILKGLNNIQNNIDKYSPDRIRSEILEIKYFTKNVQVIDFKIVITTALTLFLSFWFFNKNETGIYIKNNFLKLIKRGI